MTGKNEKVIPLGIENMKGENISIDELQMVFDRVIKDLTEIGHDSFEAAAILVKSKDGELTTFMKGTQLNMVGMLSIAQTKACLGR